MDTQQLDERRGCTSASNAQYDMDCPARHLRQKNIPEPPESQDAFSGRFLHKMLADSSNKTEMDKLTVEQRDMFDSIRSIEKALVKRVFQSDNPRMAVIRERRLWCKVPNGQNGFFEHSGQPDVIFRMGDSALILEYKVLKGDIPSAPYNMQLRDQAVLVFGNVPALAHIYAAVIQPMVSHSPELAVYNAESLKRAEREMFDRVRASNNPAAAAHPTERACKFCKAKEICQEYNRWAGATVPGMLTLLDVPVADWTPAQRGIFCRQFPIAQKWLDECKEACRAILENNPFGVEGFTLRPGTKRESITDPQKVFSRFLGLGGTPEDFMPCVSITKGKLRTVLAKVSGGKGKALDNAMTTLTEGCTETKTSAPTIVPIGEQGEQEAQP